MVDEEILAFLEVIRAFNSLETLMNSNMNTQKELKRELDEVSTNPRLIYGVVKKTTKDEKLVKLRYKVEKSVADTEASNELYSLIAAYISEIEIPNFKLSHSEKWNQLLNELAEQRVKRLRTENAFWEQLKEASALE